MTPGALVRILADRGDYGRLARLVDPEPVRGSTQALVWLDRRLVTVARHELASAG